MQLLLQVVAGDAGQEEKKTKASSTE